MKAQAVSASLLSLVLAGCGYATSPSRASEAPAADSVASAVTKKPRQPVAERAVADRLRCSTDMRGQGTLDFFDDAGGAATPEAAARAVAEPSDRVAVQQKSNRAAVAHLLRPDGTAFMRLNLVTLSDATWRVGTVEWCQGEGVGNARK